MTLNCLPVSAAATASVRTFIHSRLFCRRRRSPREMKRDDSVVEYRSSKKLTFSFSLFLPFSSFVWCSRLQVLVHACLNGLHILVIVMILDRHY